MGQTMIDNVVWGIAQSIKCAARVQVQRSLCSNVYIFSNALHSTHIQKVGGANCFSVQHFSKATSLSRGNTGCSLINTLTALMISAPMLALRCCRVGAYLPNLIPIRATGSDSHVVFLHNVQQLSSYLANLPHGLHMNEMLIAPICSISVGFPLIQMLATARLHLTKYSTC